MKANKLTRILYEKATNLGSGEKGEITERYVIPTFIPSPNVKCLDVTELSEQQREAMNQLHAEYSKYYSAALLSIFNFEDWLSHTQNDDETKEFIKWRTLRLKNVKELD